MVLEGSTSADSFPPDATPYSDADPYSSSNAISNDPNIINIAPNVSIDRTKLPKPWAASFPPRFNEALKASCDGGAQLLNRNLTQAEANALTYHLAKGWQYASIGPPLGLAAACVQLYRTRNNFSIIGWKPFKEGSKLSMESFGPLRGRLARVTWQVVRVSATCIAYNIGASVLFQAYGVTTSSVGRVMDPRLKEYAQALDRAQKEKRGLLKTYNAPGQQPSETFEQARQRRGIQQSTGQSAPQQDPASSYSRRPAVVDDASPTGGSFQDEYMEPPPSESVPSGSRWDQVQASASRTQQRQHSGSQQSSGSASAWERLRQDAMTGMGSAGQQRRPTGPAMTSDSNGFAYDDAERDRQLAKTEAQQDFDQRIQQEREGKDFNNTDGPNRRWS